MTSARRQRRSGEARRVLRLERRRSLRFEQCESRLALSASVGIYPVESADFVSISGSSEMLQSLWYATPGSAKWGDVTFTAPRGVGLEDAALGFSGSAQSITRSFEIEHGGLIGLNSMLSSSGTLAEPSTFAVDAGVGRGEFRLDDYILKAVPSTDLAFGDSTLIDAVPSGFEPPWSNGVKPPLGGSSFGTGSGDGLSSADAGGKASGTDEANVTLIESPVLRITAPLPNADDEGGSIDVTAMVAPRALFAAQHATVLATNGVGARTSESLGSETPSQRTRATAADSDELRARAVVYEVSLAREVSDESLDKTRAERTPATPGAPSAPMAPPQATEPAVAPPTGDAKGDIAADVATPKADEGESATSHQTSGLGRVREVLPAASARDAALARLGNESGPPEADLETASSRNQTLGMALAAVVGAGPLVRRMRRSKAPCVAEQPSGLK